MSEKFIKKDMKTPRQRIIMAAWDLFHEHGISGTSVDDILQKSNTGKSQFYHYFGSKEGIVHAALEECRNLIDNGQIEGCEEIDNWDDFEKALNSYVEKIQYFKYNRVCPMSRFAIDLEPGNEQLRKDLQLNFETKKRFMRDFFIKLKARGEYPDNLDPDSLVDFCMAATQGSCISSKVYKNDQPLLNTHHHLLTYLKSLLVK